MKSKMFFVAGLFLMVSCFASAKTPWQNDNHLRLVRALQEEDYEVADESALEINMFQQLPNQQNNIGNNILEIVMLQHGIEAAINLGQWYLPENGPDVNN